MMQESFDLTILIPAWNEAENLRALLPSIGKSASALGLSYEIIVVDPGSNDGTEDVVRSCGMPAKLLIQKDRGFGAAVLEGLAAAQGEYILTMDADFSHDPSFLADFWNARRSADVIIGSRYIPGGQAEMPFVRRILSPMLNQFFRRGLSFPWHDLSSGFRLYRAVAVKKLQVHSHDFDVLQELLIRSYADGNTVREIPIHYRPREKGRSHAELFRFAIAYLRTFFRMYRLRNSIDSADYDDRAYDSIIPPQRYWQRRRLGLLYKFANSKGHTLEVGCGSSQLLASSIRPFGLDIRLNKLRYSRKFGRPLVNGSIFSLPFLNAAFDCVICSEVVEHIPGGIKPLEELRRILKPGGTLVISTPDYSHRTWVIIEWLYGVLMPGGYADEHITHYTKESLTALLEKLGFQVIRHAYILNADLVLQCLYKDERATSNEEAHIASADKYKKEVENR